MALPEHVKKLAMTAVEGKETTGWIRNHTVNTESGQFFHERERGMCERVKKEAVAAVSQSETTRQIRLVAVNAIDPPLPTPNRNVRIVSDKIRSLYLLAKSAHEVHEVATKDGFGREDDGR